MTTSAYEQNPYNHGNQQNPYDSGQSQRPVAPSDYQPPQNEGNMNRQQRRRQERSRNISLKKNSTDTSGVTRNSDGSIDITLTPAKAIPLRFGEGTRQLMFTPPKTATFMRLLEEENDKVHLTQAELEKNPDSAIDYVYDWYSMGLNDDDYDYLMNRLNDDSDPLDITHLAQVQKMIIAEASGNPTM